MNLLFYKNNKYKSKIIPNLQSKKWCIKHHFLLICIIIIIVYVFMSIYIIEPCLCQDGVNEANQTYYTYMSNEEIKALFASIEQKEQDLIRLLNELKLGGIDYTSKKNEYNNLFKLLVEAKNQAIIEPNELNKERAKDFYLEAYNKLKEVKISLNKVRGIETEIRIIKPYFKSNFSKASFEIN